MFPVLHHSVMSTGSARFHHFPFRVTNEPDLSFEHSRMVHALPSDHILLDQTGHQTGSFRIHLFLSDTDFHECLKQQFHPDDTVRSVLPLEHADPAGQPW